MLPARRQQCLARQRIEGFQHRQFTNALTEYERLLAEQTKRQKPEDPRLHFNAGTAAYRATNYNGAIQHFTAAAVGAGHPAAGQGVLQSRQRAFPPRPASGGFGQAGGIWKEAIKQYQHALALDKADPDAAFNLAFVEERVKQIEIDARAGPPAKAAADDATRRRNYRRAREIMEQLLQQANAAAKPFEEFTKKLKHIDEIANPSPAASALACCS